MLQGNNEASDLQFANFQATSSDKGNRIDCVSLKKSIEMQSDRNALHFQTGGVLCQAISWTALLRTFAGN